MSRQRPGPHPAPSCMSTAGLSLCPAAHVSTHPPTHPPSNPPIPLTIWYPDCAGLLPGLIPDIFLSCASPCRRVQQLNLVLTALAYSITATYAMQSVATSVCTMQGVAEGNCLDTFWQWALIHGAMQVRAFVPCPGEGPGSRGPSDMSLEASSSKTWHQESSVFVFRATQAWLAPVWLLPSPSRD